MSVVAVHPVHIPGGWRQHAVAANIMAITIGAINFVVNFVTRHAVTVVVGNCCRKCCRRAAPATSTCACVPSHRRRRHVVPTVVTGVARSVVGAPLVPLGAWVLILVAVGIGSESKRHVHLSAICELVAKRCIKSHHVAANHGGARGESIQKERMQTTLESEAWMCALAPADITTSRNRNGRENRDEVCKEEATTGRPKLLTGRDG
jgi:hypothetical protein